MSAESKQPPQGVPGEGEDGGAPSSSPAASTVRPPRRSVFGRLRALVASRVESTPNYERGLAAVSGTAAAPKARVVLWTLVVLLVILFVWASFGKLDIVATAEGKLVPRSFVKIVQPAEAGIMQELLVREGDRVAAGQVLIRMDTNVSAADTQSLKAELDMRRLQLRRIDAELSGRSFQAQANDPPALFQKVNEQYRAYRQALADSLAQERAGLDRAQQDLASASQVRDKLQQSLRFYDKQSDTFQKLGKDGFVSPLFIDDKERERAEKEKDVRAQEFALASLGASVEQSNRKLAQIESAYRQQLQTERMQAISQFERLTAEWQKQQHKNALLELRAPHAGTVKDIASHTKGTVVNPGTILLTIVPADEPLIAEVQVKNQDSGFIYPTQTARVKVSSFPFQKYGMLDGEIAHIGADATDTAGGRPEEINPESRLAVTSHYKAHIKLKAQRLMRNNEEFKLMPGMQVVAEVRLGERTVLEYLLSPVQKAVKEAGRER